MHPIAFHVHGDGVFHMVKTAGTHHGGPERPEAARLTRQTNKFLAALGATPVAMPVPQVGEALAKGRDRRRRGALRGGAVGKDSGAGEIPF